MGCTPSKHVAAQATPDSNSSVPSSDEDAIHKDSKPTQLQKVQQELPKAPPEVIKAGDGCSTTPQIQPSAKSPFHDYAQSPGTQSGYSSVSNSGGKLTPMPARQGSEEFIQSSARLLSERTSSRRPSLTQEDARAAAIAFQNGHAQHGAPICRRSQSVPIEFEYTGAPAPANEEERYEAVCGLNQLDTPPDARFDDITKLLCSVFNVPVAIVSLVEKDRQWFKSVQGLPVNSTERRASFCAWTLLPAHPEVLVVPDAKEDIRFAENPLVLTDPFIRFYAGAPLITSTGHRLGSLCVIDRKPRELAAESCNMLINFAEIVMRELEKDRMREEEAKRMKTQASTRLLRAMDCFTEGIMVVDAATPELQVLFFNEAWGKITGIYEKEGVLGSSVWDIFDVAGEVMEDVLQTSKKAIDAQKPFFADLQRTKADGSKVSFSASFRPGAREGLDKYTPTVAIPGSMTSWEDDDVADDLYFVTMHRRRDSEDLGTRGTSLVRGETISKELHPFDDVHLGPLLGQGSFGKVFRGMWNGAHVAVKIMQHSDPAKESKGNSNTNGSIVFTPEKAAQEASLSADLSHPNIVQTYKTAQLPYKIADANGEMLWETWMVLEYCDQGSLQYAIDRGRFDNGFLANGRRSNLPDVPSIKRTAVEIAAAMCYLHSKDILHGDLSGANILLSSSSRDTRGFTAKVADFGLSRMITQESIMTQTYGTVTHMPPELLITGKLCKGSDVFAFGVVLWELFSHERPWPGMLPMQVIYHVTIMNKTLQFPSTTPEEYRKLGEACMHKDEDQRPTFAEVLKTLDKLQ